jgi:hypothetical protein
MTTDLRIQYLSPLVPEFCFSPERKRRWRLVQPFEFKVNDQVFVIPVGFWTDFASIPRALWPLLSPYDLGVGPVPHDYGYYTGYKDKHFWDEVLLACTEKDKVAGWKANAAYCAVDWFGWSTWKTYRQRNASAVVQENPTNHKYEILDWKPAVRSRTIGKAATFILRPEEWAWRQSLAALTGE